MKAFMVIRTYQVARYEIIRDDIQRQMTERGWDLPVFVHLSPVEYEDVEVVWIDEQMEMDKFIESIRGARSE